MIKTTKKTVRLFKTRVTRAHIIQSAMAGVYIFLVFWVMHSFQNRLAVASLGASTFIAFSFPHAQASRPRFLIGGYCVGAASGLLCNALSVYLREPLNVPGYIPACALAVFLSMLLMTILDFEHPPSAALAVAVTIDLNPLVLSLAGLACITILCALKHLMKARLRNL